MRTLGNAALKRPVQVLSDSTLSNVGTIPNVKVSGRANVPLRQDPDFKNVCVRTARHNSFNQFLDNYGRWRQQQHAAHTTETVTLKTLKREPIHRKGRLRRGEGNGERGLWKDGAKNGPTERSKTLKLNLARRARWSVYKKRAMKHQTSLEEQELTAMGNYSMKNTCVHKIARRTSWTSTTTCSRTQARIAAKGPCGQ